MKLKEVYAGDPGIEDAAGALPAVDIVLVHGLDSLTDDWNNPNDGLSTWTANDGNVWPLVFLPRCMPKARVLCYQYNGSIRGTSSIAGTRDHAEGLLQWLRHHRGHGAEASRPIIFVGHSLGGSIIKQSLILAVKSGQKYYKPIAEATVGIVFFATPHLLGGPDGERLAADILRAVGNHQPKRGLHDLVKDAFQPIEPNNRMIRDLQHNGNILTEITKDFLLTIDGSGLQIGIVNFIEETATARLGSAVVQGANAYLQHADTQFLQGDHIGICKFEDNEDGEQRFEIVCCALRRLLTNRKSVKEEHAGTGPRRHAQSALLDALCSPAFHDFSRNICPTEGTGQWIGQTPEFQAWENGGGRKLWIYGQPAAGKTYLAKHIVNKTRSAPGVRVLECFLRARSTEHNKVEAILRSTIHQLAKRDSALLARLTSFAGNFGIHNDNADWSVDQLMELWTVLVTEALENGSSVVLVVDGFDEISAQDQGIFLNCLGACESGLSSRALQHLRIVILSRWCRSLDDPKRQFARYEIGEQDTTKDIHRTVTNELAMFAREAQYSDDFQKEVCHHITNGAKGIYLWATVMVADIEVRMPTKDQLQEQLQELPKSLAELYDFILGQIKSQGGIYGSMTKKVLLWVIFCLEPLNLQELNLGIALAEAWKRQANGCIGKAVLDRFMIQPYSFKAMLVKVCGQLLRLSSRSHVEPVHRTLSQYLTTSPKTMAEVHEDFVVPNHAAFYMHGGTSHAALGGMCAAYLMMDSFSSSGERFKATPEGRANWAKKVQARIDSHGLVRYSALCWSRHLSLAEPGQGDSGHNARKAVLESMSSEFAISQFEVWWFAKKGRGSDFPLSFADPVTLITDDDRHDNSLLPPEMTEDTIKDLAGVRMSSRQPDLITNNTHDSSLLPPEIGEPTITDLAESRISSQQSESTDTLVEAGEETGERSEASESQQPEEEMQGTNQEMETPRPQPQSDQARTPNPSPVPSHNGSSSSPEPSGESYQGAETENTSSQDTVPTTTTSLQDTAPTNNTSSQNTRPTNNINAAYNDAATPIAIGTPIHAISPSQSQSHSHTNHSNPRLTSESPSEDDHMPPVNVAARPRKLPTQSSEPKVKHKKSFCTRLCAWLLCDS